MDCCAWTDEMGRIYDASTAEMELEAYRAEGPRTNTRILLEAVRASGVEGATLLDVGGGVGAIQHELAAAGVAGVTSVDASRSYLDAARGEAERRGYAGRATYVHGDFVTVADALPASDVVTLDRVVCCYPDAERLVGLSAARARRLLGLVYPRDAWWVRLGAFVKNRFRRIVHNPDRVWIHRTRAVDAMVTGLGFERVLLRRRWYWQIVVYRRSSDGAAHGA